MFKQSMLVLCVGFSLGFVASACVTSEPNPEHCRYDQGDRSCAQRYGEARGFCTSAACDASSEEFYGCVAEQPAADCHYPCGGNEDATIGDWCLTAGDGDGDTPEGEGEGDKDGDTGDGDAACVGPADCTDDAAPFCDPNTGACVGCDGTDDPDGACAEFDPQLPVCLADACVACTEAKAQLCVGLTPVCDPQSHACVGCSAHDQCPDSACHLAVGSCFDPAAVVHVDGDFDCGDGEGSAAKPYCDLSDALDEVGDEALIILHERAGLDPYEESNEVDSTIAIFAAEGERPILEGTGDPGVVPIAVTDSGVLYLRGVEIAGTQNDGRGLDIDGGQAWVEQCRIVNNNGGGVRVDDGGTLSIANSFVGGATFNEVAIEVVEGAASVVYTTLAAGSGDSRAFVCTEGSDSTIRNSIVVSLVEQAEIDCPNLDLVDTLTEASSGVDFDGSWFVDFQEGDFHLDPDSYPSEISTAATWRSGDPCTDIDGATRPTADPTPDFAGADRLP
ncbi:hypothetical protein ENSA5_11970 [Enhygromyxa salina]|uniref:Right handed beta helix domain-containing protein n=1 Tax=Enhygromyxa salina TaxID=215803 RepID=A0A2S9YFD4_9BACT|nr:hypothetical protein [Enhygromyxa salina]PRQ03828.1 hypothetical protein ENSA5_11970 [Enhygromyxa salina]